jgi:hypothetical protein
MRRAEATLPADHACVQAALARDWTPRQTPDCRHRREGNQIGAKIARTPAAMTGKGYHAKMDTIRKAEFDEDGFAWLMFLWSRRGTVRDRLRTASRGLLKGCFSAGHTLPRKRLDPARFG